MNVFVAVLAVVLGAGAASGQCNPDLHVDVERLDLDRWRVSYRADTPQSRWAFTRSLFSPLCLMQRPLRSWLICVCTVRM